MPVSTLVFTALDKTGKVFAAIRKKFKQLTGSIFSARAAMSAFGVFMVAKLVKSTLQWADSLGKLSVQVGVSTKFLQQLQFAGNQSGVAIAKMNTGIIKFSRSIGELRADTGSLFTLLDKSDRKFATQLRTTTSNEKAMRLFIKRLSQYKDKQDQAALAAAAFGRSGVLMLGLLKDAPKGFEALMKQAEELGLILDDKTIAAAEKTNDALSIMGTTLRVQFAIALQKAMPLIQRFTRWVTRNRDAIGDGIKGFIEITARVLEFLAPIAKAIGALVKFAVAVLKVFRAFKILKGMILGLTTVLSKMADAMNGVVEKFKDLSQIDVALRLIKTREEIEAVNSALVHLDEKGYAPAKMRRVAQQLGFNLGLLRKQEKALTKIFLKQTLVNKTTVPPPGTRRLGVSARDAAAIQKFIDAEKKKLAAMDLSNMTEFGKLEEHLSRKQEMIEVWLSYGIISKAKANELIQNIEKQHEQKMVSIAKKGAHTRAEFNNMEMKHKVSSVANGLSRVTASSAKHSRAMFNINKVGAISNAYLGIHESVMKTRGAYPEPFASIMAGLAWANGLITIRAIKNQSFGGGAGGGGAGASRGLTSPADLGAPTPEPVRGPSKIFLALPDDQEFVSKTWIRNALIPAINEELGDGAEFVT